MQTREQQIVGAIAAQLGELEREGTRKNVPLRWSSLRSISQSLPSMMMQHGPVQVTLFYLTKESDKDERKVLRLFQAAMLAVNPDSPLAKHGDKIDPLFKAVADQPLALNLRDHALSNEIATWIARSIDARYRLEESLKPGGSP